MESRYDDHHTLHNKNFHQKTIFLPMFCRLSIKDIRVEDQTSVGEPASPKVSCIGQVKRNHRVIGHSTTTSSLAAASSSNHHMLTKLKKLFPCKTILTTTTSNGARSGIRSCRTNAETCVSNHSRRIKLKTNGRGEDCMKVVNIGDLDPPLPVLKRAAPPLGIGEDRINIWKRRCNGMALKRLQIQQIHLPNNNFQPPPTV